MKKLRNLTVSLLLCIALMACGQSEETSMEEATEPIDEAITEAEQEPIEEEESMPEEAVNVEDGEEESGTDHHDELPYEWAGSYELNEGEYTLLLPQNEFGDESMLISFILENSNITDVEHHAAHVMESEAAEVAGGSTFEAKSEYVYNLFLNTEGSTSFILTVSESGSYRIFTEHHAEEFDMQIINEAGDEVEAANVSEYEGHAHDHGHDHK
ncbi:hypothetical protein [Halalkalibacterium ligniniphilum]|uniref:hypothetical protein n=1 Tax=Halalkalibacterium ligniniphilum TaxID=1134413 RepID=UPI0012677384|nr:hypothetical protein [Halalkalibacterium ligniniphilum]